MVSAPHQTGFRHLASLSPTKSIAFCITELDVGGAEKALARIAIGLKEKRWQVRVISLRDAGEMSTPLTDAGIDVTALHCRSFADIRSYFRLVAELRRQHTDILVCFLHQANIYGRLAGKRLGLPTVSGIRVADRRRSVIWPERLTRCCVDQYVAVSTAVGQLHSQFCGIAEERMMSIPNGVDIPSQTPTFNAGTDQHRILFVGRLTPQKAPLVLLEAFLQMPAELRQTTRLTFAGDGELRSELQRRIDASGVNDAVEVLGHSPDVDSLMQKSTVLVLPSRWEGMPNVVLEAMAARLPVVATAVDGTTELIDSGTNGWLVRPDNPQQLSTAISEALSNKTLREAFAKSAQTTVSNGFSWNAVVDRYDQLLQDLLANPTS